MLSASATEMGLRMKPADSNCPTGYRFLDRYDPRNKIIELNLVGLVLFILSGMLLLVIVHMIRPEFNILEFLKRGFGGSYDLSLLKALVLCILVFALTACLHEVIHYAFMWILTHKRPRFYFNIKRLIPSVTPGFSVYCSKPKAMICALGPLFIITFVGIISLLNVPVTVMPAIIFMIAVNVGISISDIHQSLWLHSHKPNILWGFDGRSSVICERYSQEY